MSRSAADATRFTATGPYASSKPGAPYDLPDSLKSKENATQPKQAQPLGPGGKPETPKQKVERLRAQARAARMAQSSSGVDRFIEYGRRFANKAHKGMVYSLIAASGTFLTRLGYPSSDRTGHNTKLTSSPGPIHPVLICILTNTLCLY
jgi:hypothetical protein